MRILLLAPFSGDALATLFQFAEVVHEDWRETETMWDPVELGKRLHGEGFDVVVVERDFLFRETFEAAPELRVAAICRSAVNQIDVAAATDHGVSVLNTPGRNAPAVAELALGLMFALARRMLESDSYIRQGRWESPTEPYTQLRGFELHGKTVGIVGFGAIGRLVAKKCQALGMRVLVYDPFVGDGGRGDRSVEMVGLGDLLQRADIISLHAPPDPGGKALLDGDAMNRVRSGAYLVNTASAELVDTPALVQALRERRLAGAAYDVFETTPIQPGHPLTKTPDVILTPHLGGATDETIQRHSHMIVRDLQRITRGQRPANLVNPEVWW